MSAIEINLKKQHQNLSAIEINLKTPEFECNWNQLKTTEFEWNWNQLKKQQQYLGAIEINLNKQQ